MGTGFVLHFKNEEDRRSYDFFETVRDNLAFDIEAVLKSGRRCVDCGELLTKEDIRWAGGKCCTRCWERALEKHHEKPGVK